MSVFNNSRFVYVQEDVVFDLLKQNITFSLGQLMSETDPANIEVSIDADIDTVGDQAGTLL